MRWERGFHKGAWGVLLIGWPTVMIGAFLSNAAIATAGVWIMITSFVIDIGNVFLEHAIERSLHLEEE